MSDDPLPSCRLIDLEVKGDERGKLVALEADATVPFPVRRAYYVFATQPGVARGFHAHRRLKQLAVCVAGSCRMLLDDGADQGSVLLDNPAKALLIPPMVWHEVHDFSPDCVLLVLADDHYYEADYIRSVEEFRALAANG
ncbi:sugar 3,4-ketoisomerase [Sphingomonas mesophila]|uniref:sugar 3,4-ketoisomerase n=1 Tax=Sphingomonas mesophila TaxID=2303576 RepID=UPI001F076C85|nr:FdtA/QdtA family cupin domain-containing protein [Sphingomonas mesophila]